MSDELHDVRAAAGRKGMASRWAQHRADRIAAGLPPTRAEELGRRAAYFDDLDVEAYWIARVRELGIDRREAASRGVAEVTSRQMRRLAVALCESETARLAESSASDEQQGDDERALVAYHSAEVARWRRSAAQSRALADERDRFANDHEQALADLLMRGLE